MRWEEREGMHGAYYASPMPPEHKRMHDEVFRLRMAGRIEEADKIAAQARAMFKTGSASEAAPAVAESTLGPTSSAA